MSAAPVPATQLGKYRLVATLGQGGMGTVYLALASGIGQFRKLLVVKELRQDLTRQAGFVTMFMDEAKLAARLDHPNVVQTFEASQQNDRYYLAMEYLDGQPLSALIDRVGRSDVLPLWVHIQILCEALTGLHYAHELTDYDGSSLQVVHRDVSPQNVFVTYHGQVKVVDFGVAKAAGASTITDPGVFKGKFAYAAPEQVLGRPVDARTDIFAIGIMLWQAIAGQPYSEQAATPAAFRARASGRERRIAEVVPSVDPLLAQICDRALAVNPDDRFDSAADFRAALQDYLSLSGVRVEATEIGQLMRDLFDKERRAVHLVIEQAMKHDGASDSSVESLPFFYAESPVDATAVADLSSLIDVSVERDDEKIRLGYAHSKVSMVRSHKSRLEELGSASPAAQPQRWIIASMALSGVSVLGLIGVLLSQRAPAAPTLAPVPAAQVQPAAQPAQPPSPAQAAAAAPPSAAAPTPAPLEAAAATPSSPAPRARTAAPAPVRRGRESTRTNGSSNDSAPAPVAAREPAAPATREPAPAAQRTESPQMGTDLKGTQRRVTHERIDMEDPYR